MPLIPIRADAQKVMSIRAGLVEYLDGDVFLDGARLKLHPGGFLQVNKGQTVHTERGRAEIMLGPGTFCRIGLNASLRLEEDAISNPLIALEKGSALIEVVEKIKDNILSIRVHESIVTIGKEGLYRIDVTDPDLRVYGGTASVSTQGKRYVVKKREAIRLERVSEPAGFDQGNQDMLHKWSAQRSFTLFVLKAGKSSQRHWVPISMGWLMNYNYNMRFYTETLQKLWLKNNEEKQSAESYYR